MGQFCSWLYEELAFSLRKQCFGTIGMSGYRNQIQVIKIYEVVKINNIGHSTCTCKEDLMLHYATCFAQSDKH